MGVDYKVIGQRIQQRRKKLHKTQDHLAEALAVSVGYVSQIERGVTKINLETLSKISRFLDCGIADLINGTTSYQPFYLNEELGSLYQKMNPKQKRMLVEIARTILRCSD